MYKTAQGVGQGAIAAAQEQHCVRDLFKSIVFTSLWKPTQPFAVDAR
jgi:hypothetical protein